MTTKSVKSLLASILGHKVEYFMTNPPRPAMIHFKKNTDLGNFTQGVDIDMWEPTFDERIEAMVKIDRINEYLNQ